MPKKSIKPKIAMLDSKRYVFQPKLKYPPQDEKSQNKLANEILEYGKDPNHDDIKQFAIDKGYNPYRLFKLTEVNEYFALCLETAMSAIGIRRERAARERKQDATSVFNVQPLYDSYYRQLLQEKREWVSRTIAERESTRTIVFEVVTDPVPSSNLVPIREVSRLQIVDNSNK